MLGTLVNSVWNSFQTDWKALNNIPYSSNSIESFKYDNDIIIGLTIPATNEEN